MTYVNTDDIKKLVRNALGAVVPYPSENKLQIDYGILRGYLYAMDDILAKDED